MNADEHVVGLLPGQMFKWSWKVGLHQNFTGECLRRMPGHTPCSRPEGYPKWQKLPQTIIAFEEANDVAKARTVKWRSPTQHQEELEMWQLQNRGRPLARKKSLLCQTAGYDIHDRPAKWLLRRSPWSRPCVSDGLLARYFK